MNRCCNISFRVESYLFKCYLVKFFKTGFMMECKNVQYWLLWYSICSWNDYQTFNILWNYTYKIFAQKKYQLDKFTSNFWCIIFLRKMRGSVFSYNSYLCTIFFAYKSMTWHRSNTVMLYWTLVKVVFDIQNTIIQ